MGMNWFHRLERRYIEYGSSFEATRTFGLFRAMYDLVYNMNLDHLSWETQTVFERLGDAGVRTAGTPFLIYRGRRATSSASRGWPSARGGRATSATRSGAPTSSSTGISTPAGRPGAAPPSPGPAPATSTRPASARSWSRGCLRVPALQPAGQRLPLPPPRPRARGRLDREGRRVLRPHRRGGRRPRRVPRGARGGADRRPRPDRGRARAAARRRARRGLARAPAEHRPAPRTPRSRSARPRAPAPSTSSTRGPGHRATHERVRERLRGPDRGRPGRLARLLRWRRRSSATASASPSPTALEAVVAARRATSSASGPAGSSATCAGAAWTVEGEPEALDADVTGGRFESRRVPGRSRAAVVGAHLAARRRHPDLGRRRIRVRRLGRRQPRRRWQPRRAEPRGLARAAAVRRLRARSARQAAQWALRDIAPVILEHFGVEPEGRCG